MLSVHTTPSGLILSFPSIKMCVIAFNLTVSSHTHVKLFNCGKIAGPFMYFFQSESFLLFLLDGAQSELFHWNNFVVTRILFYYIIPTHTHITTTATYHVTLKCAALYLIVNNLVLKARSRNHFPPAFFYSEW